MKFIVYIEGDNRDISLKNIKMKKKKDEIDL